MPLHRHALNNGLRVVVEEMPERQIVAFNLRVGAGWVHESAHEEGLAHFTEHMLFQGTQAYPSHARLTGSVEALGGQLFGATAPDYTSLWTTGAAEHAPQLLDSLLEMLIAPRFDPESIERERSVLQSELEALNEEPLQWMLHHLNSLLWPGDPLSEEIESAAHALPLLGRDELVAFHQRLFRPNRTVLAAGGRIDPRWLVETLERRLGGIPPGSPLVARAPAFTPGPRVLLIPQDGNVGHLMLAFPAPTYGEVDRPPMEIIRTLLAGGMSARLYHALRIEHGIAHHIEMVYDKYQGAGVQGIYLEFPEENLEEVIHVTLEQIRLLAERGPSGEELARAIAAYQGECLFDFDTVGNRVRHLALTEYLAGGVQPCESETQDVARIEADRVRQVARRYFSAERAALCLYGPVEDAPDLESRLRGRLQAELPGERSSE